MTAGLPRHLNGCDEASRRAHPYLLGSTLSKQGSVTMSISLLAKTITVA
jgi:hypothetical protein